jgi:hypothetical protein
MERVAAVKPKKLYLICDGGRNPEEHAEVLKCRESVESAVDWDCEIHRNYADSNRGVYANIALGAQWVFSKDDRAIFLEDDNLPEITFFRYCHELLDQYEADTRVLWICGTNYLERYEPEDGSSYVFTKHLLPCGWASWAKKFTAMYDGNMTLASDARIMRRLAHEYGNRALYRQQRYAFLRTRWRMETAPKTASWDYQMAFALRVNGVYGISPKVNQIQNIGADERSTHGGTSLRKVMTRRFCGVESFPLEFPLRHPQHVLPDVTYEKRVAKIVLLPLAHRCAIRLGRMVKPFLGIGKYEAFSAGIRRKLANLLGRTQR